MTSALNLLQIEMRRGVGLWFAIAIALLTWFAAWNFWNQFSDLVTLWAKVSAYVGHVLIGLGPLMAGAAAWTAARARRRRTEELLATTSAPAAYRELFAFGALVVWGLAGYMIAVAVVFAIAAREASWGAPLPLPVVAAVGTIVLCTAVGYAAGTLVPSRLTAALVPPVLIFLIGSPDTLSVDRRTGPEGSITFSSASQSYLTPWNYVVDPDNYDPFYSLWEGFAVPLTGWLLGLAGVAFALVALSRDGGRRAFAALALFLTVSGVAGVSLYESEAQIQTAEELNSYSPVCASDHVTVCVHPAYEAVLDDIAGLVNALVEPFTDLPGALTRVEQTYYGGGIGPDGVLRLNFYNLIRNGEDGRAADAGSVTRALICDAECTFEVSVWCDSGGAVGDCGYTVLYSNSAQAVIGIWTLRQARIEVGTSPAQGPPEMATPDYPEVLQAAARFGELDEAARQAWLRDHIEELRAGKLRLEDLP